MLPPSPHISQRRTQPEKHQWISTPALPCGQQAWQLQPTRNQYTLKQFNLPPSPQVIFLLPLSRPFLPTPSLGPCRCTLSNNNTAKHTRMQYDSQVTGWPVISTAGSAFPGKRIWIQLFLLVHFKGRSVSEPHSRFCVLGTSRWFDWAA